MNYSKVIKHIVNWLNSYTNDSHTKGYVVGISGGIDSAVTSTLAASTGRPTLCLEMPIFQSNQELERSGNHIEWLKNNFSNVNHIHNYSWYVGNFPTLEKEKIDFLIETLNKI